MTTSPEPICTLIIAVYNQARQLALLLDTVKQQKEQRFELIVADDGSSDDTAAVVEAYRIRNPDKRVKYLWQKDEGFRKTFIQNEACRQAQTDYFIFVDGDMLLDREFIGAHLVERGAGKVLCGYRGVKLQPIFTEQLLSGDSQFCSDLFSLLVIWLRGGLTNFSRALHIRPKVLRKLTAPPRTRLSGCNFSISRQDMFEVNGFDESITEYGYEDYDLGQRLRLAGKEIINVSKLANTFHLYHESKATTAISKELRSRMGHNRAIVAVKGIDQT